VNAIPAGSFISKGIAAAASIQRNSQAKIIVLVIQVTPWHYLHAIKRERESMVINKILMESSSFMLHKALDLIDSQDLIVC